MILTQPKANPFDPKAVKPPQYEELMPEQREAYLAQFRELTRDGSGSVAGGAPKLSGLQMRPIMEQSGLPTDVLSRIWRLADWDTDGWLDENQFVVAMHYCKVVAAGGEIPDKLPAYLLPAGKLG